MLKKISVIALLSFSSFGFSNQLADAIQKNRFDAAHRLIAQGANVNDPNREGRTPLHLAAKATNIDLVNTLIAKGADINATDQYGATPLHMAAETGNVAIVQALIAAGALVNTTTINGNTPLHLAAMAGQDAVVQILLTEGATVNAQTNDAQTALHWAAMTGNVAMVQALLAHTPNLALENNDHQTAFQVATPEVQAVIQEQLVLAMPINHLHLKPSSLLAAPLSFVIRNLYKNMYTQRLSSTSDTYYLLGRKGLPSDLIWLILSFLKIEDVPVNVKKYKRDDRDEGGGPSGGGRRFKRVLSTVN